MMPDATLKKASLVLFEAGRRPPSQGGDTIQFMFNPKEYSIQKSADWQRDSQRRAKQAPKVQFKGTNARSLSLEVFLDAEMQDGDTVAQTAERLMECCAPTQASIDRRKPMPPNVLLRWGQSESFVAFVKQVQVRYTLFTPDGEPLRATCTVELEEVSTSPDSQNPTSGTPTVHRTHTVVAGDSLHSIAYGEYRDPRFWRAIATINDVDDPLRLPAGAELLLPPPAEARSLS